MLIILEDQEDYVVGGLIYFDDVIYLWREHGPRSVRK